MSDYQDSILVVDDDALISHVWCMTLEDMGLAVCGTARTAKAAIALAQKHRPKVVLLDVRLRGEMDGVDAALEIHRTVGCRIIFVTGSRDPATTARMQLDHPTAVLFKPVSDRQFKATVSAAMAN